MYLQIVKLFENTIYTIFLIYLFEIYFLIKLKILFYVKLNIMHNGDYVSKTHFWEI